MNKKEKTTLEILVEVGSVTNTILIIVIVLQVVSILFIWFK